VALLLAGAARHVPLFLQHAGGCEMKDPHPGVINHHVELVVVAFRPAVKVPKKAFNHAIPVFTDLWRNNNNTTRHSKKIKRK